jgi:hypothetical protein
LKKLFWAAEAGPGGLITTRGGWKDHQPLFQNGLTTTRGGLIASNSNGQKNSKL